MESRRAVHAVGVEQRDRRIAERRRALDERFGQRRTLQKAEGRRGVEFDVQGRGEIRRRSGVRISVERDDREWLAVESAVNHTPSTNHCSESRSRKHPIRHTIGQRHVPLVAIPADVRLLACCAHRSSTILPMSATDRRSRSTPPPSMPRRSIVTRDGLAISTRDTCRTGCRNRRSARATGDAMHQAKASGSGRQAPAWLVEARSWRKWLHRKCAGLPGVDERRATAARVAHQRLQPRDERRELLRRRQRPREQRKLHDAAGCRIDGHHHAIDGCRRRMRFEIEQQQRAQRRASRIGTGSCSDVVTSHAALVLTRCSRTCRTAAPRSRRSRCADSGSSSRPSTNESGSSPSIGHSRSSACSKRSSGTAGTSGATSSPRASRCQRTPSCPRRAATSSGGSAANRRAYASPIAATWQSIPWDRSGRSNRSAVREAVREGVERALQPRLQTQ